MSKSIFTVLLVADLGQECSESLSDALLRFDYKLQIILQQITNLLKDNEYVALISTDFSHAFDTVRHSTLVQKMLPMDIPDHIFNWLVNYFEGRAHCTRLGDIISIIAAINASIVQGSVIGPPSYVIVVSDLHPLDQHNKMVKFADNTYLLVGSRHIGLSTAQAEFNSSAWPRVTT